MTQTIIETSELYDGKVKVDFYPKSHMYKITDQEAGLEKQRVKGVTTYLGIIDKSIALVSWASDTAGLYLVDRLNDNEQINVDHIREAIVQHRKVKDDAASIGSEMHDWCEYFIKHKLGRVGYEKKPELPEDPQILLGVRSFLTWYKGHDVEFIDSERVVYSRKHNYVGQADFIAKVDGKMTLGDFKSSNGLYNSVRLQTQMYADAYTEETGIKFDQRMAVRLSKETETEYQLRMERKHFIKGKEDAEIPPYVPFEWMTFDDGEDLDREAYIATITLTKWNDATDFYKNKKK